jgi:hypothetical protein
MEGEGTLVFLPGKEGFFALICFVKNKRKLETAIP